MTKASTEQSNDYNAIRRQISKFGSKKGRRSSFCSRRKSVSKLALRSSERIPEIEQSVTPSAIEIVTDIPTISPQSELLGDQELILEPQPQQKSVLPRKLKSITDLATRQKTDLVAELFDLLLNEEKVLEALSIIKRRVDPSEVSKVLSLIAHHALVKAGVETNTTSAARLKELSKSDLIVTLKKSYLHHAANKEDKIRVLSMLVVPFTYKQLKKYVFPDNSVSDLMI